MRLAMIVASLLAATSVQGAVTFVAPLQGAQVIGPHMIEVATDIADVDRVEFLVDGVLVGVARTPPYRVNWDFGTNVESRTVTARVLSNGYRESSVAEITTASLGAGESMNVDLVEVPLRVRSSRVLAPSDLRLRENSVEHTIREITPTRGAAHFAFVVDRSLSMGGGRLDAALKAVEASRALLRDGDSTSLVLFNHHVTAAGPLTDVTPSGGTALRDAIASTVDRDRKRTYVIVITDGGDRNSILSDEAALQRVSGTKTIVSAIVLGRAAEFLERVTEMTGGSLLRASVSNVDDQIRRVIDDINSRYTVIYQSHGTATGWRTIRIEPRHRGISIVTARKGYFAE